LRSNRNSCTAQEGDSLCRSTEKELRARVIDSADDETVDAEQIYRR
jgi:hypothetical protein